MPPKKSIKHRSPRKSNREEQHRGTKQNRSSSSKRDSPYKKLSDIEDVKPTTSYNANKSPMRKINGRTSARQILTSSLSLPSRPNKRANSTPIVKQNANKLFLVPSQPTEAGEKFEVEPSNGTTHEEEYRPMDPWIKRKFYIVENGGRPSEIFCTDFVHKAKYILGKSKGVDDSRLMKITDRWRQEWDTGVQVPLQACPTKNYTYENVCLFPDLLQQEPYELPRKLIAQNRSCYVDDSPSIFEICPRTSLYQYELDRVDEEWLEMLIKTKGRQYTVNKKILLDLLNAMEMDCYMKIHTALLEPLNAVYHSESKSEDEAECDICRMPEWEVGDEILFCDGCNICVHMSCYGLDSVPSEEWLCRTCSLYDENSSQSPKCIFCPLRGGAMTYTKRVETWAHVVCALWLPEVRFEDVEHREPITHISDVPAERWQSKCSICDTRLGACISCTATGCEIPFHVSCAQRSGLVMRIENSSHEKTGVSMISLCRKHSALSPYRHSKKPKNINANTLEDMTPKFYEYVDCKNIGERLGLPMTVINTVLTYWKWKRRQNLCQPLINEPLDEMVTRAPFNAEMSVPIQRRRKQHHKPLLDNLPPQDALRKYEFIQNLRHNLEKARNLSYMIQRREKTKMALLETSEKAALGIGSILLEQNGHVPISKRRTDRFLELWDIATRPNATASDVQEVPQNGDHHEEKLQKVLLNSLSPVLRRNKTPKDIYEFRRSNSPIQNAEIHSDNDSDSSTPTEYSIAHDTDSFEGSTIVSDFENNAVILKRKVKRKKKKDAKNGRIKIPMAHVNGIRKPVHRSALVTRGIWKDTGTRKKTRLRNKIA